MNRTKASLAAMAILAILLVGAAVPALAQESGSAATEQATDESTEESNGTGGRQPDYNCDRQADDAA